MLQSLGASVLLGKDGVLGADGGPPSTPTGRMTLEMIVASEIVLLTGCAYSASSAARNAPADWKRLAGDFSSARATTAS